MNEEIRLFRSLHGEGAILCALIDGTPVTSFPPALLEGGREPLAADLSAASFKLGVTQIAASMLGVGLDDLVQRDLKRLRRRVTAVTAGAITALLVMGSLTWTAISSRDLAEQRRDDAEEMIEFMITDLKDELQSVGRLQPMTKVGERAAAYYDDYDLSEHDDDALGRRARVFHFLGETQGNLGNLTASGEYFERAFEATEILYSRNPNNADRVFDHAQSAYWVGYRQRQLENYSKAKTYFQIYLEMAECLQALEVNPSELTLQELSYANTNMGAIELNLGNAEKAKAFFEKALSYKEVLFEKDKGNKKRLISLAKAYTHLGRLHHLADDIDQAIFNWNRADILVNDFHRELTNDAELLYRNIFHSRGLSRLHIQNNEPELAKLYLEKGFVAANKLAFSDNNNKVIYEKLLLDIVNFEIHYVDKNIEKAAVLSRNISRDISKFPHASRSGRQYKLIYSIEQNLPIYISIANNDEALIVHLAEDRLKNLKSEGVHTYKDIVNSPYTLSAVVLVNLILGDAYTSKLLYDYCNTEDVEIGYERNVQLAVIFDSDECPNMASGLKSYPSVISNSAQFLAELRKKSFHTTEGD